MELSMEYSIVWTATATTGKKLPGRYFSLQKWFQRKYLTWKDFEQLQEGVKYTDIVKEIGEPTGTIGFGLIRLYYAIQDVYIVMYFSYTGDGEYDKLLRMEVCDENEKLYELKLKWSYFASYCVVTVKIYKIKY